MTPKEKANDLVQRFTKIESFHIHERVVFMPLPEAKQCALIVVDEIRTALLFSGVLSGYWQEVYLEIEKL